MQVDSQKKFIDRIKNEWSSIKRQELCPPFPETLMLELTNGCNLKCIMCQNTTMQRKTGLMSLEIIEQLLVEASENGIKKIALYTTGEPLIHPKFTEIVRLCKDYGFYTYTTSNGLLLNSKKVFKLIEAGLDSIKISIDGADKETYEKIRVGGKFEKLLENLKMLKEARDQLNSDMKIYAGAVVMNLTDDTIEKFRETYSPLVDGIYFSPLVNQSGQISEQYNDLKSNKIDINTEWQPCKMLWDRLVIAWNGSVSACCVDYELDLEYASYKPGNLKDIWQNQKMQGFRKAHLEGHVEDMALCKTCNAPMIQQSEILDKVNSL